MDKEKQIDELLTRGVGEIIGKEHLKERLLRGEKLRVKFGIDPTSPNIHLGRSVPLLKLRDFQQMGHTVMFIVGNFTGLIGDTSDKESERPMLDQETVSKNAEHYFDQAGKIIDMSHAERYYNAEWLESLQYRDIGEQADVFSLHEFIERENIRKRLDEGKRISLREVLYPIMQGYDSVKIHADVEIGGTDQRFNMLAGRKLQERYGQIPQDILTVNLILGTDGRKMSSSWGNTINLIDTTVDMFGKVMSIPDDNIISYFTHTTRVSIEEIDRIEKEMKEGKLNPRDAKLRLAKEIVAIYHSHEAAEEAEQNFVSTFSKGEIPENIREVALEQDTSILDLLVSIGFAATKSEARRKVEQGGVEIDGEKVSDWNYLLTKTDKPVIVRCGKKDFVRVVF